MNVFQGFAEIDSSDSHANSKDDFSFLFQKSNSVLKMITSVILLICISPILHHEKEEKEDEGQKEEPEKRIDWHPHQTNFTALTLQRLCSVAKYTDRSIQI